MEPLNLVALEAASAIVHRVMPPTPHYPWPLLSARAGCTVWLKHENAAPTGAFKVRGGLVHLERLKQARPGLKGVIAATRGNHGQSVAFAAARLGLKAKIVVPHGNSPDKNRAMQALGATLIEHGHDFQAALEEAERLASDENVAFVRSFHPDLVAGVASYALELFRAAPDLDAVYVPIGLGSGICGVIAARDALGLKTEVIGVVSDGAPAYALSFAHGAVVSTNRADTFADGLACRVPVPEALAIIKRGASRVIAVSDDAILDAIGALFSDTHHIAEGAAAAPLAALLGERGTMAGKTVGLIVSGGNIDAHLYRGALDTIR
ncbi:MAG: threonine dehydratase [Alphaproteobacteria bacterium]|nr:threonine dehydratase [Alphaproteobacteria bacterium]